MGSSEVLGVRMNCEKRNFEQKHKKNKKTTLKLWSHADQWSTFHKYRSPDSMSSVGSEIGG